MRSVLRSHRLPWLLLIVAVQVLVNYHTWLISGPDHLYFLRGLNRHPLPYIGTRIEYPVLTGAFMTAAAAMTHGIQGFLRLNSFLLGGCALVHDHAPQALAWYDRNIAPREAGLRLLGLAAVGGAMLAREPLPLTRAVRREVDEMSDRSEAAVLGTDLQGHGRHDDPAALRDPRRVRVPPTPARR